MEDIVVFLGLKVFNSIKSCIRHFQITFVEKQKMKIISFKKYQHRYLNHILSDNASKGTIVIDGHLNCADNSTLGIKH